LHIQLLVTMSTRNLSITINERPAAIEHLNNRSILRVSGNEASVFLQGLVTNDMQHLEDGSESMYTMFLNIKGRVMYDTIVYRTKDENTFFLECDKSGLTQLQKHLKLFRVRKKIDIENIDNLNVWVLFNPKFSEVDNLDAEAVSKSENEAVINSLKEEKGIIACRDPRLSILGVRILAPSGEDVEIQNSAPSEDAYGINYRLFRYKLGIGEGVNDLPPGNCFPLESNCDYLHGISFHKGCYLGQELTARTHHTGVIRKRLMPLIFEAPPESELKLDTPIQHPNGSNKTSLGKLRGVEKNVGLGLLRISQALDASKLKILDFKAETMKPSWWPQEVSFLINSVKHLAVPAAPIITISDIYFHCCKPKLEESNMETEKSEGHSNEGGVFKCSKCGLEEHYMYKGKKPPFAKKIVLLEESYVIKDPFSPPNEKQFLLLGSDCRVCSNM
ncbi:hypothetical protein L9F63_016921, partial [Diploptera punctata]